MKQSVLGPNFIYSETWDVLVTKHKNFRSWPSTHFSSELGKGWLSPGPVPQHLFAHSGEDTKWLRVSHAIRIEIRGYMYQRDIFIFCMYWNAQRLVNHRNLHLLYLQNKMYVSKIVSKNLEKQWYLPSSWYLSFKLLRITHLYKICVITKPWG